VVATALVMLMQAGFALVEADFSRVKTAASIVTKDFLDFSVGALAYWAFAWALAHGGPRSAAWSRPGTGSSRSRN
jgi:Amt family ammonium transporter